MSGLAADEGSQLPGSQINWYCWYALPARVICLLEAAPAKIDTDGVDFESLKRLPPGVTVMRADPARLRGQRIEIPLHSPPLEMGFTALLARSVMCGSQRRCAVSFDAQANPARIAAILDESVRFADAEATRGESTGLR